jgi:hypothetical protein
VSRISNFNVKKLLFFTTLVKSEKKWCEYQISKNKYYCLKKLKKTIKVRKKLGGERWLDGKGTVKPG